MIFYFINLIMVGTDMILYFRNRRLDAAQEIQEGVEKAE